MYQCLIIRFYAENEKNKKFNLFIFILSLIWHLELSIINYQFIS